MDITLAKELERAEEAATHYGLGVNGLVATTLRKARSELEAQDETIAQVREQLGRFNSEDPAVMAMRAMEEIERLEKVAAAATSQTVDQLRAAFAINPEPMPPRSDDPPPPPRTPIAPGAAPSA